MTLLDEAVEYAHADWPVFPVGQDKRPLTEHGFQDATTDVDQIRAWWSQWPEANIAWAIEPGFVVIDIDPRNGGRRDAFAFPETREVQTAGGGWHLYYRVSKDARLRGKLDTGIDVKGGGKGYVLLPPSRNTDGAEYRLLGTRMVKRLPNELLDLIRKPDVEHTAGEARGFVYESAWGRRAMESELGRLATARPGERNDQLNKSAFALGQIAAGGEIREDTALEELRHVAEGLGLEAEEIERTIASGFSAGQLEPRNRPDTTAPSEEGLCQGAFTPIDPATVRPPRHLLQAPYLYESALTWLWGPSGHGKSLAVDKVMAELSHRQIHACLWDWEDTSMEIERLDRLGANFSYAHVFAPREGDTIYDFATPGFVDRVIQTLRERDAKLAVFNPFFLLVPPASRDSADAWNTPVKDVANACRRIIAETGATIVVTDHQEDVTAEHAHGGRSKKALTDLYIRVTRLGSDYMPGQPYHFTMRNLKQAREHLPLINAEVEGEHHTGPLQVSWNVMSAISGEGEDE